MSSGILSFIAGLGTGYVSQTERERDRAGQEKLDQIAFDRADAEKKDRERKAAGDQALIDNGKDVTVNDGATVTGVSAQPTTYDSANVALVQRRAAR